MLKNTASFIGKRFIGALISLFIYDEAKKAKHWIEQKLNSEEDSNDKKPFSAFKKRTGPFKIYKSQKGPYQP